MSWLSWIRGLPRSNATITVSGKQIEIFITASARRALALRDKPLLVEIEIAFACMLRKGVRFHEALECKDAIRVSERLALFVTTIFPGTCEPPAASGKNGNITASRSFLPKRVRIDWSRGKWIGEYDL